MTDCLYHGSLVPGIKALEARSRLHGANKQVVYLTDSVPYALFYIWDGHHNGYSQKYVTGGFRDGVAFYEEQFPDQLRTFYQGVSGFLYRILKTPSAQPVAGRAGLFWLEGPASVADAVFVPDVYDALLEYEAAGQLRVLRYNEQTDARRAELVQMIAAAIRQSGFFAGDPEQQQFMQTHFAASWRIAHEQAD